MKRYIILLTVCLAVTFFLVSCKEEPLVDNGGETDSVTETEAFSDNDNQQLQDEIVIKNTDDGFEYYEKNDGIVISAYRGNAEKVVIPDKIDGKNVAEIGANAFWLKGRDIVSVEVPSTVKKISFSAFNQCSSLKTVKLSEGLEVIESSAFRECTKLSKITLPDTLKVLEMEVFMNCTSLKKINIPENLTEIAYCVFASSGLERVEFSGKIKTIHEFAFAGTAVSSIKLPASVETIGDGAFSGCVLLSSVDLNDGLKSIGDRVFSGCLFLEKMVIPASVKQVNEMAFNNCPLLKKVVFEGDAPDLYSSYDKDAPIIDIPYNVYYTVYCKKGAKGFTFPLWNGYKTVVEGGDDPAKNNGEFDYVVSNGNVTLIKYTGNKKVVTVPPEIDGKKVTSLGSAFKFNESIVSVAIPDTVTVINVGAFYGCNNLLAVSLPQNLKEIGGVAFSSCKSLKSITFPDSLQVIGSEAFVLCTSLTEVELPSSLKETQARIFSNCRGLKSATVPGGLKKIGEGLFCFSGLEQVTVEEGITEIGDSAFYGSNLKSFVVPNTVKKIGKGAFGSCESLKNITLNEGLTEIGDEAFYLCTSLSEIVVPQSVRLINDTVFNNCRNLKKVKFQGDAPEEFIAKKTEDTHFWKVDYTVCYHNGAKGFTSPEWCGYKTTTW